MLCTYYIGPKLKLIVMGLLWVDKTEMTTVVIFFFVCVFRQFACLGPRYIVGLGLILLWYVLFSPYLLSK